MDDSKPFILSLRRAAYDIASCEDLARELQAACTQPNVIVDFSAVTYLDSTCLSKLVAMRKERAGRGFPSARLAVPSEPIRRLFDIVHFDAIWPVYDSLEAALTRPNVIAQDAKTAT